ncbi:MAG: helix-turn-helix domain-containing protein [Solirubrobacteraceae bacterium]
MPTSSVKKRPYRMSARAEAAAATRERLLAAAWQHFASHPYEDVRLQGIAAEAGVTAQTLHTQFGSKDQLLTAAYVWFGEQEMTQRDTAPTGDIHRAIEILFDRYEVHGIAILRMLSQEDRIPAIAQMTEAGRAYHCEWAAKTFTPLLRGLRGASRERRLAAIVVATDLLVWKLLRHEMQLDRTRAEAVVVEMMCYSS